MTNSKCGEVTYCTQVGKRVYVLNCIYCSQICLQWEMFINHLEQEHESYLNLDPTLQPETSKVPVKMEVQEVITDEATVAPPNKKQKMFEDFLPSSAFDDPLESENSNSEMGLESTIKIEQEEESQTNPVQFETEDNSSEMETIKIQRIRESKKRYIEKLKKDPQKYKEHRKKKAEGQRRRREETNAEQRREKDRIRKRKLREWEKNNVDSNKLQVRREKDRLRHRLLRARRKKAQEYEEKEEEEEEEIEVKAEETHNKPHSFREQRLIITAIKTEYKEDIFEK